MQIVDFVYLYKKGKDHYSHFMIVVLILGHWGFDGFETESLKNSPG